MVCFEASQSEQLAKQYEKDSGLRKLKFPKRILDNFTLSGPAVDRQLLYPYVKHRIW
jgi:hypothetical protein